MESARPPHRQAREGELLLQTRKSIDPIMKDGGRQSSVRLALLKHLHKVGGVTCAARSNNRNPDTNGHPGRQFAIKTVSRAIAVNGSQENLSGASLFRFSNPGDDF